MFYSICFLVLFKYKRTENRPHMTEKSLTGAYSVYTEKLSTRCIWVCITFVYQSLRRYTVLALESLNFFCNISLIPIFTYRVHVSIRCCYTFPFTYTYSYAANPDNSNIEFKVTKVYLFWKIELLSEKYVFAKLNFLLQHQNNTFIR